jgi:hypothetical protein
MKFNKLLFAISLLCMPFSVFSKNAKWTILVYMNADNDLEDDGIKDFLEMAKVENSEEINILVQFDRTPGYTNEYGDWKGTMRFKVQKGSTPSPNEKLSDLGEMNMGDPAVFRDFISWGKANYPADHYVLVVWGHGQGWKYRPAISSELALAYNKQFEQEQLAINNLKYFKDSQKNATWLAAINTLTKQQNSALGQLNTTAKNNAFLPNEFKTALSSKSDYAAVFEKYSSYVSNISTSTISKAQLDAVNKYSALLDHVIDIDYNKKNLSSKIVTKNKNQIETVNAEYAIRQLKNDPVKSVSNDDTDNDFLYNREIQDNLNDNEFAIIGFDACLMSMLETAYALKSKAAYLVGSEELEPGTGWNYTIWLNALVKNPDLSPLYLSKSIVDSYRMNYAFTDGVTLSSVNLGLIQALLLQIDALSQRLISQFSVESRNIVDARKNCLKYAPGYSDINSIDLSLFVQQLAKKSADLQLKNICNKINVIISSMVVENFRSDDRAFVDNMPSFGSFGVAIYFPKQKLFADRDYNNINHKYPVQFVRDCRWAIFLEKYYSINP